MNYKIKLEVFEGPLDLLLYLIRRNDIDISDIPIAKVTDQYMQYIDMMKMLDLNVVGDFLVMAATLMHIKSKMLLPPDPSATPEEQEDPRDELARRLYEYQKFKEIAEELKIKEQSRRDLFGRNVDEESRKKLIEASKEVYFEASLFDLINAFTEALKKLPEDVIHEIVKEEYTVEQKIHEFLHLLLDKPRLSIKELFAKCKSKVEMIVTFLAILELIRLKEIKVIQASLFGDIEVHRNRDNIVPQEEEAASVSEEIPADAEPEPVSELDSDSEIPPPPSAEAPPI